MDPTICESYNSCIVTPKQVYPNNNYYNPNNNYYNPNFQQNSGFNTMNCVSYIPTQESGLIVNDSYNFSDGYSIDNRYFQQPMPINTTLDVGNYNWPADNHGKYMTVEGTEMLPESLVDRSLSLTPSFFASNSAFKRIPLHPGKKIFRRRKPGDCTNEWSNAFDNEEDANICDVPCCTN